jgi:hypothetical protein
MIDQYCIFIVKANKKGLKMKKNKKISYDFWLRKIKKDPKLFMDVPEEQKSAEFCFAAVKKNGLTFEYVPDSLKTAALCLAAVKSLHSWFHCVSDLQKTEAVCLSAVKDHGFILEYVPKSLRTESVCLAAVKDCDYALEFVPESLKNKVICLADLNESVWAQKYVPKNIKAQMIPTFTIRLTDDEIVIINIWAKNLCDSNKQEKMIINEKMQKNGGEFLIDSHSQSKLINTICINDPSYNILSIEFRERNTEAILDCSNVLGPLWGGGFYTIYSKEKNIWKHIGESHWLT